MITNERQYKITKTQVKSLQEAVKEFNLEEAIERIGSKRFAQAELDGLKSEIEILENQLQEFENLKLGLVTSFRAESLAELPTVLIRARIAQNLSQRELGEIVGLKEQQIQRYESEQYASASLTRLREIADALKLNITEIAEIAADNKQFKGSISTALEWHKFPAKEMYKRGWFEGFSGSLKELTETANELVENFILTYTKKPSLALHRKKVRSGSSIDPYALLAWECRIRALASEVNIVKEYNSKLLTRDWFENLKKLSVLPDGPIQAKTMLQEFGITLIIEPHLPNTHLDGAAMLLVDSDRPIIGLTLRYDRIDNFWFVLFHELIHVSKHLQKGKVENIFDDLDLDTNLEDEMEKEADNLANEFLIPSLVWEKAIPRYIRSPQSVLSFASNMNMNPAIVAGRIRREADNYIILKELIGQGEVRKQFSEVNFGS